MGGDPFLSAEHRKMLEEESGIDPEVIAERGYRTVTKKVQLKDLGFPDSQRLVPALLIPVSGVDGEVRTYQSRPDQPRMNNRGTTIKYETKAGSKLVIDVPLKARHGLGDPSIPLFVTEGSKKADAAVSRCLCCVALIGVWGFRGTNEFGGKAALPDWESIPLNDRVVYVVFDSDVMTKGSVRQALERLKAFLESKKAKVRLVYLPAGEGGAKVGLDDYFVADGTVDGLMRLATDELPPAPLRESKSPYFEENGRLYYYKARADGVSRVLLATFTAMIMRDILQDDGLEQKRIYEIEATIGDRTVSFRVAADQFASLNWVAEKLGARAIRMPGQVEHLRTAIQELSDPVDAQVFAHTGWREIGGQMFYLHAGGAIGEEGLRADVEVLLEDRLQFTVLPPPPDTVQLRSVIRKTLDHLVGVGPAEITYPLLAATARAVIGGTDHCHFLFGKTGAFKSELATFFQAFFGPFHVKILPANWKSTANYLESLAFAAKDMLIVVDDYSPRSPRERDAIQEKAERLFRGKANQQGRQRLGADLRARPTRYPRGLILATGEELPAGQSLRARIVFQSVGKDDITAEKLTVAQELAAAGVYALTMSGYLQWLAPQIAGIRQRLPEEIAALRGQVRSTHRRTPTTVADLAIGLRWFLQFARDVEAISEQELEEHWDTGFAAISACGELQTELLSAVDPVDLFLRQLTSALATGAAHLADFKRGGEPAEPAKCGWSFRALGDAAERAAQKGFWVGGGEKIGWLKGKSDLYIDLNAAMAVCRRVGQASGEPLTVTPDTLKRALFERGLIRSTDTEKRRGREVHRLEVRIKPGDGPRVRALHMDPAVVFSSDDAAMA